MVERKPTHSLVREEAGEDAAAVQTQSQSRSVLSANQKSAQAQIDRQVGGPDEQVVILEASTSRSHVGLDMSLFQPNTRYALELGQGFFDQLASPTGAGFLDLAQAGGPDKSDKLHAGDQAIDGSGPGTVTFTLTSMRGRDGMRVATNLLKVEAANNGMLALARLASAYLSAVKGGAIDPNAAKLSLVCHVTMGTDPRAADEEARRETFLTTTPPSFSATANGTANGLLTCLLGAYGFGDEIDPSESSKALLSQLDPSSSRAAADKAEQALNNLWRDTPQHRTFIKQPMGGIADAIMASATALAPNAQRTGAEGRDLRPGDVRGAAFPGRSAIEESDGRRVQLDPWIQSAVLRDAKAIVARLRDGLVQNLSAGLMSELPNELQSYHPLLLARWTEAIDTAFARVNWELWYSRHFEKNVYYKSGPSKPTLLADVKGNDEGYVQNPLRLHRPATE